MNQFKSVSLADQVFEKLEDDIITGVYSRGEILTEMKLVEQMGVSRTPIREALRRLEQERLIMDSSRGSLVLGITIDDLEDIMDIRQRVEGLAAYYAAQNITPEGAAELRKITELQEFYFSKHDVDNLRQMDDRFHGLIYEMTGRSIIHDTLQPLHRKALRFRRISIQDDHRMGQAVGEHREIAQAILSADAELAARKMTTHIANAKESMIGRCKING